MKNIPNKPHTSAPECASAKARLLEAAIDVFGKEGFSGATTRMIARRAGVNISAIPYYFGGKEGLYRAVVVHIAEKVQTALQNALAEIERYGDAAHSSSQKASALLDSLLAQIIDFMLGSPEAPRFVRIVLREQLDPSAAYQIIYAKFMSPIIDAIAKLLGAAAGIRDFREAHLRALAIMGQVMSFRIARETLVRMLDIDGYSPAETAEIREVILEQTRAALKGLSKGRNKY